MLDVIQSGPTKRDLTPSASQASASVCGERRRHIGPPDKNDGQFGRPEGHLLFRYA